MRSSNRSDIDPFIVMDVMEAATAAERNGQHIIHMEVGQPGTPAPQTARDAVTHAMNDGALGYTVAMGLPDLRSRIAQHYGEKHNVDLDPKRVVITSGSSAGFLLAFTALFDAGENVGIGVPGYPSYRQILKAMSLNAVLIETTASARFQPTPQDISENDLDGLLVASPANPTGSILDKDELSALVDACTETDTALISDEIYHGIEYERQCVSALEITQDAYVINSFSKYFSMTGWRVGWMVVPDAHVRTLERLAQNMFICPPHVGQVAALGAFEATDEIESNVAVYAHNRDIICQGLSDAGFRNVTVPDGAFYVYVDITDLQIDSRDLARDILENARVAVTPGVDFDPDRGQHFLRFSYARSTQEIETGIARLTTYMREKYS